MYEMIMQLSVLIDSTYMSVVFSGCQQSADSLQLETNSLKMQSADDEENRVTNTSSTQNACNSLPRSCSVSSNALASGPNDAHVLTAREFAQSVECWLWQQQCWAQQLSWMSWMHYNMPLFAAASAVAVPASTSPTSNDVRQNLAGSLFQPAANQQLQAGNVFHV